jgi:hypothetical protein
MMDLEASAWKSHTSRNCRSFAPRKWPSGAKADRDHP